MNATDRTAVTMLGLGRLGQAVAAAFLANGHPVTVWNRTPGKADDLVARGATRAATAAEAVAAGDLVVVCVLDYPAVRALLEPAAPALAGKTLVNLTSGTAQQARETAGWAAGHGAAYLDGAVLAVPPTLGTPAAFVLYSGAPDAFAEHRAALEVLGDAQHVGSDAGLAAVQDLALLSGMYGMLAGFFQAVAMADADGIGGAEISGRLVRWLRETIGFLPALAEQFDGGDHATDVSSLEINRAGLAHIQDTARAQGVGTALLAPLAATVDRLVAEGHGADGLSRVIEAVRKPAA